MTTINNVNTGASTSTSSTTSGSPVDAQTSLNQNYNTFLKLLTTQMQYQDPLQPEDSSQFTNQLVLFSQVEQQIDTNTTLSSILSGQSSNANQQALGYLGLNVTANGSAFNFDGADSVNLGYTLPSAAASTSIGIFNANGEEVYQQKGQTAAGSYPLSWDGNDSSGNPVPAGAYSIEVSSVDATGAAVTATTQVPGQVTGVTSSGGTTYLTVNGQQIALSDIVSASLPSGSGGSTNNQTSSN